MLKVTNIRKAFKDNEVLKGVDIEVNKGDIVTILGPSGSGKTTLLRCINFLEQADGGQLDFDEQHLDYAKVTGKEIKAIRHKTAFVFQNYNLLAKTTALENVELPLMYNPNVSATERVRRAKEALIAVGLGERLYHKSNQMSGGQMQRVAIARALVNNPAVILADEATGNLDTRTSFEILVLFQKLHTEGRTIIFVTHNPDIAQYSSRNIMLKDGKIVSDTYNSNILSAADTLAKIPKEEN